MKYFLVTACLTILLGTNLIPFQVEAQGQGTTNYTLLAPLPLSGPGSGVTPQTTAAPYIQGIFTLTIAIAGILAIVMIIFGGIKYMSTDAFSGKDEAKTTIRNAITGLLLAIAAWLILYTINPNLVSFQLSVQPQPVVLPTAPPGGGGGGGGGRQTLPGYVLTPQQLAQDAALRATLSQSGVSVNAPPCANGGTSGCTNVVGLSQNAINGVTNLATACNCSVTISGGTEGGHQTHGPNPPNNNNMDLGINNSALNNHITSAGQPIPNNTSCGQHGAPAYSVGGATYVNEGNHWHVCY